MSGKGTSPVIFIVKSGTCLDVAKRQRCGRQTGDAVGVKNSRRNDLRFRLRDPADSISQYAAIIAFRTGGGMIILELVQTGRKLHVLPSVAKSESQRPVPAGAEATSLSSINRKLHPGWRS